MYLPVMDIWQKDVAGKRYASIVQRRGMERRIGRWGPCNSSVVIVKEATQQRKRTVASNKGNSRR